MPRAEFVELGEKNSFRNNNKVKVRQRLYNCQNFGVKQVRVKLLWRLSGKISFFKLALEVFHGEF